MLLTKIWSINLDGIYVKEMGLQFEAKYLCPFLKIGETFAFNQSVGTSPVTYDFRSIKAQFRQLTLMPCPHHTSPGYRPRRHLLTFDVYGPCDLWRAGVDGLANLISQSCDILKMLLLTL